MVLAEFRGSEMRKRWRPFLLAWAALASFSCGGDDDEGIGIDGPDPLSFFVTSIGSGAAGGNYGGLVGADMVCTSLADAVGASGRLWRAYLSTSTVDARDRIGIGPWYNAAGIMIAADLEELHTVGLFLGQPTEVLDENGDPVPVLEHDIVTGSLADGTVAAGRTCLDWTSDSPHEVAQVGHSDLLTIPGVTSIWNSSHESASCTEQGLAERLGSGRFYCFAVH